MNTLRNRPSVNAVLGTLVEGPFGRSRDLPPSDPIAPAPMVLDIAEIAPYDRNPRVESNERYDDIKDSVKARGIDAPLRITRRPGAATYMIAAGGNTRLAVIQELFQETGDDKFRQVHCLYTPWRSESDVLTGHLVENELRADLIVIDKARALRDLKSLLEEENGSPVSRSAFTRHLEAMGYRISRRQLIRYEYAIENLFPAIPTALRSGMGVRAIDEIRDTQQAYRTAHRGWADTGKSVPPFEPLWEEILSRHDGPSFDLQGFRKSLDATLAEYSGIALNKVRLDVDAALFDLPKGEEYDWKPDLDLLDTAAVTAAPPVMNSPPLSYEKVASHDDVNQVHPAPKGPPGGPRSEPEKSAAHSARPAPPPPSDASVKGDSPQTVVHGAPSADAQGLLGAAVPLPEDTAFLNDTLNHSIGQRSSTAPRLDDLKSWRARAAIQAQRFAQHLGLPSCVVSANQGLGFFVELPEQSPAGDLPWAAWWMLLSLSEQCAIPPRMEMLPASMKIGKLYAAQGQPGLYEQAGKPPATTLLGLHLLSSPKLPETAFRDLLLLIETCRALKTQFRESDLWACQMIDQYVQFTKLPTGQ